MRQQVDRINRIYRIVGYLVGCAVGAGLGLWLTYRRGRRCHGVPVAGVIVVPGLGSGGGDEFELLCDA